MNKSDDLHAAVQYLALNVVADDRWLDENDTYGVRVLGFILYGFALKYSRILAFDPAEAEPVMRRVMTEIIDCAPKWTDGFLAEAKRSAFDPQHARGHFDLIAVGSGYDLKEDLSAEVDNFYANLNSFREAQFKSDRPV